MAKLTVEEVYRGDKHTLIAAKKMLEEGNSISDIPKLRLPSLHKEGTLLGDVQIQTMPSLFVIKTVEAIK